MLQRLYTRFRFTSSSIFGSDLNVRRDNYNAIHLTPQGSLDRASFNQYITDLLRQNSSNNTSSIWVHINKNNYNLIDQLINQAGFKLHFGKGEDISLYRWMREGKKDLVPAYSTHVISCGGVIINEDKILLVEEKSGALKGKFGIPGGRADPSQSLQNCAERQVFEQIGLASHFRRILWLRQLAGYVYGSFDMYYACLMSYEKQQLEKLIKCQEQIASLIWIHLGQLQEFMKKNSVGTQQQMAKYIASLYKNGYDFQGIQSNYKHEIYESPFDKKKRWFGQHFLG